MAWQRPKGVTVPTVWGTVDGERPMSNGKIPRFRIQDLTQDLEEDAIRLMKHYFITDEPFCSCIDMSSDDDAVEEFGVIWKALAQGGLSQVALLDNPEDFPGMDLPTIVGCNIVFAIRPGEKDPEIKNQKLSSLLTFADQLCSKVDCFEEFNVPVIMYEMGVTVAPLFRQQGVGVALLRARFPLGKAVGISLSKTIFTGDFSQKMGKKAGFKFIAEMAPDQYTEGGKMVFENVTNTKGMVLGVVKLYETDDNSE